AIGESLAPADAAVIRGDPDEDGVELRPAARLAPRPRPEIAERYLESDRFDIPDAHGSGQFLQGSEIAVEFLAAERAAALEIVADLVLRQLLLRLQRRGGEILGSAGRPVAELQCAGIVPPGAPVVGHAVDHFVDQIRLLESDADQLHEILRFQPDRQPPLVHRLVANIPDADAEDTDAMFVRVKRPEPFAEQLAQAVARIGFRHRLDADPGLAR